MDRERLAFMSGATTLTLSNLTAAFDLLLDLGLGEVAFVREPDDEDAEGLGWTASTNADVRPPTCKVTAEFQWRGGRAPR